MSISFGAVAWTGIAALASYRALVRPVRAVFDSGEVTECPGSSRGCELTLGIRSATGPAPVYSLVSGTVSRVVPGSVVEIASAVEPVIVSYVGALELNAAGVQIAPGQAVRVGQVLGRAASIGLAVAQLTRLADGRIAMVPIEPASWLASRGLRVATTLTPGMQWCQGGRTLVVPAEAARCGMRIADPPGFSLLPVNVRLA